MKNKRAIIITSSVILCALVIFLLLPSRSSNHEVKLPPPEEQYIQAYDKAKELIGKGDLYNARGELAKAYNGDFSEEVKSQIKEQMIQINETLLFAKDKSPDSEIYTVENGDTLDAIAKS